MSEILASPAGATPARRPPAAVIAACVLMAGFAVFEVVLAIFIATELSGDGGFLHDEVAQFTVAMVVAKALIAGIFPIFIWRKQAWSRVAYAVLTMLGLLMSWSVIRTAAAALPLLQLVSLVLLFLPVSDRWFARPASIPPDGVVQPLMTVQPDMMAPARLPIATRPATLKFGIGLMFLVLGLGLWCSCTIISAWMASWPNDDSALAYLFFFIPIGALMLGDVVLTVTLAVLMWNGFGAGRLVYGAVTALGLRLVLGILAISPARGLILYAACLACFVLLFAPPSNRWYKSRIA